MDFHGFHRVMHAFHRVMLFHRVSTWSLKLKNALISLISPLISPGTKDLINANTSHGKCYWNISPSL